MQPRDGDAERSVDRTDLVQFERLGAAWWDEDGPMAPLHRLNPTRIRFIRDVATKHFGRPVSAGGVIGWPLAGLKVLDVGCGGGLLAEPMARLGGQVTGIDPAPSNIEAAQAHANEGGLTIDYRATTAEALARDAERFDLVLASEVIEHVVDQPRFVATLASLVAPGGLLVVSTLNRTAKAFLLAIVGAEYVLGWLPRGTHQWDRFITPDELSGFAKAAGLGDVALEGITYNPLKDVWSRNPDTDVNYLMSATRPAPPATTN
jgi:2-polyprenyl-6-hydroxyphenyl methylase / 3-demethylubiquinone-9 3-methyltransferase